MIVVMDTNVLILGLLSVHNAPARVLDLLIAGDLQAAYDDRIAAEYRAVNSTAQVLARPGELYRHRQEASLAGNRLRPSLLQLLGPAAL